VAKKDAIEVEGTVLEPLPNTCFAVELENGAPRPGSHLRQAANELHPHPAGDRVRVELSPYDLTGVASPIVSSSAVDKHRDP